MVVSYESQIPVCKSCHIPLTDAPVDAATAQEVRLFHEQTEHGDDTFFTGHNHPPTKNLPGDPTTATSSVFVARQDWGPQPNSNRDKPKGNGKFPTSNKFH